MQLISLIESMINCLVKWLKPNYDLLFFILIILLIIIILAIARDIDRYLNKSLNVKGYLDNLFQLFKYCFILTMVAVGRFYTNDSIMEWLKSTIIYFSNMELLLIKGVLVLLPTVIVYFFVKFWTKWRSNSYNFVCNILLNIFFFIASSLILYLIFSNKCPCLLPYLAFNNIIVLTKNMLADNLFNSFRFRYNRCYIMPQNVNLEYLEGPATIVPDTEFKEKVRSKIFSILGYESSRGTNNFFARFTDNNWEFMGGFFGVRDNLHNKFAIIRESSHSSFDQLSLAPVNKLSHFSLSNHQNNPGKFIHVWTPIEGYDFGLNLYKRDYQGNRVSVYLKAYDTINAPIQPKGIISYTDFAGREKEYNATYFQHVGKRLSLCVVFDDGTKKVFSLNTVSPNRKDFILPFCSVDSCSMGMYFHDNTFNEKTLKELEEKLEMLDKRIHTITLRIIR